MNTQEALRIAYHLAVKAQLILADTVGLCHKTKEGNYGITFGLVGVTSDLRYGVMQVDAQRVPPRVNPAAITKDDTLHQLTIMTGYHFHKLNTIGVTLCAELDTSHRKPLPRQAYLELADRPAGEYMIPVGIGRFGPEWRSLTETNSILVGGETRGGKSTWLNAMLVSLLLHEPADRLELALIDPKGVEFIQYQQVPHLSGRPIATTPMQATQMLAGIAAEMDRRQALFGELMAKKLSVYNRRAVSLGEQTLPLILVVIDEVTDIALQAGAEFEHHLIRLASKGASFGIILTLATQNPKAEVLNTLIRGNLSTRIAFRVTTHDHSRVILGVAGAEALPRTVRGRMMARLDSDLVELQGYLVLDAWIDLVCNKLRGHALSRKMIADARRKAARPRLADLEKRIVRYALENWSGTLTQAKVYEAFAGEISKPAVESLYRRWLAQGWLELQAQGKPTLIGYELEELAGGGDNE